MTNKDLLKEAIAEATTIREAAIANAKEALEESITPHLREMLAQKLQEMDELEETDNNGTDSQVDGEPTDIDHGNIVNEDEDEDAEEEAPEEEAEETEEDEEFDLENMTKAEFTAEVEKIVAQVQGAPEGEAEMPGGEDLEDMEDDNTIDIDELLAELEGMNGEAVNEEEVDENWGGGSSAGNFSLKPGEKDEGDLNKWIAAIAAKTGQSIQSLTKKIMGTSDSSTAPRKSNAPRETRWEESVQVKEDLNEALKAVKILRNQLQEVNLLNAKLLYVNKVFKSNNLSEGQKVNVIAAFDKAETVKEVKLVFETVSKNVVVKKPTTVKEHRSFASKATGMTAAPKKEIISEVSEQVLRMQKLAGIIK